MNQYTIVSHKDLNAYINTFRFGFTKKLFTKFLQHPFYESLNEDHNCISNRRQMSLKKIFFVYDVDVICILILSKEMQIIRLKQDFF